MSLKKILGFGVLLIVLVAGGIIIYLSMNYSSIVKAGVETYGPQFTQTAVSLDGVNASPLAGEVAIAEFLVGNPKGYKTSHAFKVREVKIAVDLGSLTGKVIRIKEIVIDQPDIIYELGGPGGSNLQTIQQNVSKAAGAGSGAGSGGQGQKAGGEQTKVIIDNLYIRKPKVALSASMLGGKTVDVPVPDIHLKDIGKDAKDGGGTTLADASAKVMDELAGKITNAAKSINLDDIKKQVEGLTKGTEGIGKGVGDATKGVTEGIKGILGK